VRDRTVTLEKITPEEVGIGRSRVDALRGADARHNAEVARGLLAGEKGAVRDAVLLNAAAALVALQPSAEPVAAQLRDAMATAAQAVDSGAAAQALDRWVRTSRSLAV
jgi:anthranilate phosphoribosyltransferase